MYGVICKLILKQDFLLPSSWIIPLFQISGVLILFFTAPSKNILATIGAGVGAFLKNASASFSDIVSYIRLWAVGLAGGKVAGAFNDIAAMIPMFVLRIPVYIIGHSINIILGVIAILAHGVRLNLLEFSNHLELEWSGRKYDPFKEIK
jgi:V/A-type H+-transporting ATPase subunit I